MKKTLTLFSILFFLFVINSNAQSATIHDINVMSFNVRVSFANDGENSWDYRKAILYNTIKINDPSIIGLQEPTPEVIEGILENFPEYSAYGVSRDAITNNSSESCHILYKNDEFILDQQNSNTFWFSETPSVPGSMDPDATYRRICTFAHLIKKSTRDSFYVYNNHFDHLSAPARLRSSNMLKDSIAARRYKNSAVIVTGDLNDNENEACIVALKEDLKDTYRVLYPDTAMYLGITKHDFHGSPDKDTDGNRNQKIDYIFIEKSGALKTIKARIETYNQNGSYPSDHYPITALLRADTTKVAFSMSTESEYIINGNEDGVTIAIKLYNDTFNSLTPINWNLTGLPQGVSILSIDKISNQDAIITLTGNATETIAERLNLHLTIAADELASTTFDLEQGVGARISYKAVNITENIKAVNAISYDGFEVETYNDIETEKCLISNIDGPMARYFVNIPEAGEYTIKFNMSSTQKDVEMLIKIDTIVIDTIGLYNTLDLQNWTDVYAFGNFQAGMHEFAISLLDGYSSKTGIESFEGTLGYHIPNLEIDSAFTNSENTINIDFSRRLNNSIDASGITFTVNDTIVEISEATFNKSFTNQINFTINDKLAIDDVVKVSYDNGNIKAYDGASLVLDAEMLVTNNLEMTGINNAISNTLQTYPNPTYSTLTVFDDFNEPVEVSLYNSTGQMMHKSEGVLSNKITIDMKTLDRGTYFIKISNSNYNSIKQIVKL